MNKVSRKEKTIKRKKKEWKIWRLVHNAKGDIRSQRTNRKREIK
jgi:hypothetical protein